MRSADRRTSTAVNSILRGVQERDDSTNAFFGLCTGVLNEKFEAASIA